MKELQSGQAGSNILHDQLQVRLETQEVNWPYLKEELERHGMKLGPATVLADFAKECKEKKLKSFSSYKTKKDLNEVLEKYEIVSGDIIRIPLFIPPPPNLSYALRHSPYGSSCSRGQTKSGDCGYLLQCRSACDMNIKYNKKNIEGIYSTSSTEDALKDDTELRRNVKRVLEVIVGKLKDRVEGSEEPATKKRCVEEITRKNRRHKSAVIKYRPPFLNGLELDAFFQKYRIALEVQGAQHRLHSTSWYKDVKKLEYIVNRDRQKRCICLESG
ncbi:hypothetical protein RhiirA4_468292 [Rhizophagus irregularis]|uniref:Uncharacterized protein n=1 Tax=Rhizophagus irregularis TaxID=588596 RepID=A0A2I1GXG8_9GLOM|nr:hypothetical protein RhiirA4_468292 [Rhizophagus irregularis]